MDFTGAPGPWFLTLPKVLHCMMLLTVRRHQWGIQAPDLPLHYATLRDPHTKEKRQEPVLSTTKVKLIFKSAEQRNLCREYEHQAHALLHPV